MLFSVVTQLDVHLLAIASGIFVPLLTAALTKKSAPSWLKAVFSAALSALAGGLAVALETNGAVDLKVWLDGMLTSFIAANSAYVGFLKPAKVTTAIQEATSNFGVSSSSR